MLPDIVSKEIRNKEAVLKSPSSLHNQPQPAPVALVGDGVS